MDPMMMAIIAVVVLVLIAGAFFFMKSRGGSTRTTAIPTPPANRPKTLAEQQRDMEQQRLGNPAIPTAPSVPTIDPLTTAQQYVQRQDLGQAITTLKTAIQQDSQRSALYLLLLNIFAQQKNLAEFNQYLSPLLALNDPNASSQAMSLKKLLDDELAFKPVPVITTKPESIDFDGFDFNETATPIPAVQPVMATSIPTPQIEDTFSFDDIEFPSVSTPTATSPAMQATVDRPSASQEVADDLAFSIDDTDNDLHTVSTPLAMPVSPAAKSEPVTELEDFSFDFDEPTSHTPNVNTPTAHVASTTTDTLSLDDEFSFDEPVVTPVTSPSTVPVAMPIVEAVDDFDLGMDDFEIGNPTLQTSGAMSAIEDVSSPAQVPDVVEDFDFNFDDTPAQTSTASVVVNPPAAEPLAVPVVESVLGTTVDDFAMDEFNFDLDDVKAEPSLAPITTSTSTPAMAESDEMVFGLTEYSRPQTVHSATLTTETVNTETTETFGDEFDLEFDIPETPVASQKVTAPVSVPTVKSVDEEPLFELDTDTSDSTPTATVEPTSVAVSTESPTATVEVTDEYDTFNQLDDLSALSETVIAPTPSAPTVETPQAVVADVATTPVTSVPVTMDGDLMSIVNGLDTAQLNIDLATQYMQLGEYDSAKRLLAEITQANSQQQQQIIGLMDKIA